MLRHLLCHGDSLEVPLLTVPQGFDSTWDCGAEEEGFLAPFPLPFS